MDLVTIIVLGSIISSVLGVVFWMGVGWLGIKAVRNLSNGDFPSVGARLDPQFMAAIQEMQALLQQAQRASGVADARGLPAQLSPHVQAQFQRQMLQAQRQMRDMDALSRQRHDLFVSDMLGQASSAGIDVSGWRF